nr:hypothetical protein [Tanacetum cinerariifolium]GEW66815.1 hypothetical protein [Tanacetum cinerariifolium]
ESKDDPKEDSEEEEEPKKKRLMEASKSDSNIWPLDESTSYEETDLDQDSTPRSGAKAGELEDTCERNV